MDGGNLKFNSSDSLLHKELAYCTLPIYLQGEMEGVAFGAHALALPIVLIPWTWVIGTCSDERMRGGGGYSQTAEFIPVMSPQLTGLTGETRQIHERQALPLRPPGGSQSRPGSTHGHTAGFMV